MEWMEHIPRVPLAWLLERENPSVRALALTELLDRDAEDEAVVEARQMIADAPYTAHILEGQHAEGYWGTPERYFAKHPGTNPVPCYTGWLLWGLQRSGYGSDPRVRSALRWVVNTMRYDDGDQEVADPDNGCWGRHVCVRSWY